MLMGKNLPLVSTADGHPFRHPSFWTAAISGAILSLIVTGYEFPANNNVFHLPIVGRLYDEPEFAGDAFVQSMRYFSSGLWLILAGSAEWVEPRRAFLALLFLSRLLSLVGFLACADYFGIRETRQRFLFAMLIAVTPLMQGASYAGNGGLFINYFTHSEVANGLFLLAIWPALRGNFTVSLAMIGVTVFVNAFFGVWVAFVLAFVVGHEVLVGRLGLRRLAVSFGIGFVVSTAFALPVILNIASNPDFGRPINFDYVKFLESYYPYHFLIYTVPSEEIIGLAIVLAIAVFALLRLGDPDRRMSVALAACVLLYAIGIAVPWLTDAPLVLNLQLLRSGTMVHELAALLLSVLMVRWWFGADRLRAAAAAGMTVAIAIPPVGPLHYLMHYLVLCALLIVVAADGGLAVLPIWSAIEAQFGRHRRIVDTCVLAAALLLTAGHSYRNQRLIAKDEAWRSEWAQIADWARRETREGSIFMTPTSNPNFPNSASEEEERAAWTNTAFEFVSHRSLWVDYKRGAPVLWRPSYHSIWRTRFDEVRTLTTFAEKERYARANGVSYIVDAPASTCEGKSVFRTKHLCVAPVD
jgi:hypothetical protein